MSDTYTYRIRVEKRTQVLNGNNFGVFHEGDWSGQGNESLRRDIVGGLIADAVQQVCSEDIPTPGEVLCSAMNSLADRGEINPTLAAVAILFNKWQAKTTDGRGFELVLSNWVKANIDKP